VRDRGRRNLMVNRRGKKEGMTYPAKRSDKKKMKKVISMVLTGIDPSPLWRTI
jgi:hypothetical protein